MHSNERRPKRAHGAVRIRDMNTIRVSPIRVVKLKSINPVTRRSSSIMTLGGQVLPWTTHFSGQAAPALAPTRELRRSSNGSSCDAAFA